MKYENEEKAQLVRKYFELQASRVPVSVRPYAAHVGVKYYTFREWDRDYKASDEYRNLSTKEYSEKRIDKANNKVSSSADDGFSVSVIS